MKVNDLYADTISYFQFEDQKKTVYGIRYNQADVLRR